MSTKRRFTNRPYMRFTPKAIAIFKRLMKKDWECEKYDSLMRELRQELKITPGEGYPIIVFPGFNPASLPVLADAFRQIIPRDFDAHLSPGELQ